MNQSMERTASSWHCKTTQHLLPHATYQSTKPTKLVRNLLPTMEERGRGEEGRVETRKILLQTHIPTHYQVVVYHQPHPPPHSFQGIFN